MALNHVIEKGKPQCKLLYRLLKEEDEYDPLFDMTTYPTLTQLILFSSGIHHCVTVVGKCIFDSNFTFALPLTEENLDYCCMNDDKTNLINGYKGILK